MVARLAGMADVGDEAEAFSRRGDGRYPMQGPADPLEWAKHPRSPMAMKLVQEGAEIESPSARDLCGARGGRRGRCLRAAAVALGRLRSGSRGMHAPVSDYHRPFAEQVAFFKAEAQSADRALGRHRHEAHDRSFIVAGAKAADLLTTSTLR
jgi:hypothetical protein